MIERICNLPSDVVPLPSVPDSSGMRIQYLWIPNITLGDLNRNGIGDRGKHTRKEREAEEVESRERGHRCSKSRERVRRNYVGMLYVALGLNDSSTKEYCPTRTWLYTRAEMGYEGRSGRSEANQGNAGAQMCVDQRTRLIPEASGNQLTHGWNTFA